LHLVAAKRRALKFTYSRELYHSCARSRLGNSISTGKIGRHSPSTTFVPLNIEVNVGESVPWINPTEVAEPYSVTFLKDKKHFAEFAVPFRVANSTNFQPLVSDSNAELVFPPGQPDETSKTVVMVNARAVMPAVIDSRGEKVSYLPPNSNYKMNGTESYVNSGWLWPEGQAPAGGPLISKFTVTFEKSGTFPYLCNFQPWTTGSVTVK